LSINTPPLIAYTGRTSMVGSRTLCRVNDANNYYTASERQNNRLMRPVVWARPAKPTRKWVKSSLLQNITWLICIGEKRLWPRGKPKILACRKFFLVKKFCSKTTKFGL